MDNPRLIGRGLFIWTLNWAVWTGLLLPRLRFEVVQDFPKATLKRAGLTVRLVLQLFLFSQVFPQVLSACIDIGEKGTLELLHPIDRNIIQIPFRTGIDDQS